MKNTTVSTVLAELRVLANPEKAVFLQRFFKTGPGEYGEGDTFWGITVPQIRSVAKKYIALPEVQITRLLRHKVHEVRLCALLIMVCKAKKELEPMYRLYLNNLKFINNWDLIDLSAEHIVGEYLQERDKSLLLLFAQSKYWWERRIAMVASFRFIKRGEYQDAFQIAEILINDPHDLIQKAVGWMLREVGKRCSQEAEEQFLEQHAHYMPRTMLRYAIERFDEPKKKYFMNLKVAKRDAKKKG